MTRTASLLAAMLLTSACAYQAPTTPSAAPVASTSTPSTIGSSVTPGFGVNGGQATITATVRNRNGAPLTNVPVAFYASVGSLSPTTAVTDVLGNASTILTALGQPSATVLISAGSVRAEALVAIQPRIDPPPSPPSIPPPNPPPPPPPSSSPSPQRPLAAALGCSATSTTIPSGSCTVYVSENGALVSTSGGSVTFLWGDGTASTPGGTTAAHLYAFSGTFVVFVDVHLSDGRNLQASTTFTVPKATATGP